jgi:WD40 repeat protein/nucleoside phosphorylase
MARGIQRADVCIVCALEEEANAVEQEVSERCQTAFAAGTTDDGRFVYRYTTILNNKHEQLTLLLLCQTRPGPVFIALDLRSLLETFQPRFVAMSGMCAGDKRHLRLGDLVVAEYAYHFEEGKVTRDEIGTPVHEPEGITYGPAEHILRYVRTFGAWETSVLTLKKRLLKTDEPLRRVMALMASGMAVRSDDPFEGLQRQHRKTWALDMEAASFYLTLRAFPGMDGLVVKGVVDYADLSKDDRFHAFAAHASAVYLLTFIQEYVTMASPPQEAFSSQGMVQRDWGEAPDIPVFFGRTRELLLLEQWIIEDRCRLVAIVGMKGIGKTKLSVELGRGGIGKTDLSLKLARGIEEQFDYVIWRRLLNAPKVSELVTDLIKFLSNQQEVTLPDTVSEQIARLLHYLRKSRCLVILDNAEMLLQGGKQGGHYHPGYEEYGQLFEQIAEIPHQSCVLLTSREKMPEIARHESQTGPVRSLELPGLHVADGKKIFAEIGTFSGAKADWKHLNDLYNGNPLALELAARHIKEVFFGRISAFLSEGKPTFADLRDLLDWHFNRLADAHKELMYWLAINREPTTLSELKEDLLSPGGKEQIASTLHALQRLIPLEKSAQSFTLQPVLIEYMTEQLVEQVVEEVKKGEIHLFNTHALLKTSVSDYVRDIQSHLILKSMGEKLLEIYGNQTRLEARLKEILALLREHFHNTSGYAGGNVLNLLCSLKVDLRGYDFSRLSVWHAYLRGVSAQEVNFAHAHLAKSVFTDTFGGTLCVALSPLGGLLASGRATGEIQLWHVASGLPLQTFRGHTDWVHSVAFSPDGKILASGSVDQTVHLWEVSSGTCLNTLHGHTSAIHSVAFSPDGRALASGGDDQTVRLWEVSSGKSLNTLFGHSNWINSVAFSPDGKTLASGSHDQTVRLWEVSSGKCLKTLQDHTDRLESVAFSPDGRILSSGSHDQTVRLWEVSSGKCLKTLQGHTSRVYSVAFSPDGRTLASGSDDQTVRLWKVSSGKSLNTLQGHTEVVLSVAFSPDGRILASGYEDRTVRLWEVSSGKLLKTLQGHTGEVYSVAFSPDGRTLASGSGDQTVCLWKVSSGKSLNTLFGHSSWINSVAFSPDGKILASGSYDRTVRLWKVSSGKSLNALHGHANAVRSVAFSSDGSILASGSYDQTVRLWEVSSGTCLNALHGHANAVRSVAFSPDGSILASGSYDQTVRLWEVGSGKSLNTLIGHSNWVCSMAFSPDGKTLASGSGDQTVRLWEVGSGKSLNTLIGHSNWVCSVAFSPDGRTLASGSGDGTINLWDSQTGACLHTLRNNRPYEWMNITQVKGLTGSQKATLKSLGAIEDEEQKLL